MSDLRIYIENRKKTDSEFVTDYDKGYQEFKLGACSARHAKKPD